MSARLHRHPTQLSASTHACVSAHSTSAHPACMRVACLVKYTHGCACTCVHPTPLNPGGHWGGAGPGQLGLPLPQLRTQWAAVLADINECLSNPCVNGACRNLAGSYACDCDPGSRLGPSGTVCLGERALSPIE